MTPSMFSGSSAPNIEVGSAISTMNGSRKLSNWRRQHQIDHDQREDEGEGERIAFLHELPALALEIVGIARREDFLRRALQEAQSLAERMAGEGHAGERRRIELLEAGQRVGLGLCRRC